MSAERGWIGDPQPSKEWHTPGWLSENDSGRSHFHSNKYAAKREQDALSAEHGSIGDPQPSVEWRDSHYSQEAEQINTQPDPLRG